MSAATANRDTPALAAPAKFSSQVALTLLASEISYAGLLVSRTYDGEVKMAADTLGERVIGVSQVKLDNTADGELLEGQDLPLQGVFRFDNSSTVPLTEADKGAVAYVEDDHTVGATSTNLVAAGIVHSVDASGVWLTITDESLALARRSAAPKRVSKTDDYTVTAADCWQGNVVLVMAAASAAKTFTLPTAQLGYRVGFVRGSLTAGDDVSIAAASGDTVLGSAAAKKVDNTVDAVSQPLWVRTASATAWLEDSPAAGDFANWVINNT